MSDNILEPVRSGNRWLHSPPPSEELAAWFSEAVDLHDGMEHADYLGGIVLIGATDKLKVTKEKQNGDTYTAEVEQAVHIPYPRVDIRVKYWWDLLRQHKEWVGFLEPVPVERTPHPDVPILPEGFFSYYQEWWRNNDTTTPKLAQGYVGATWRAVVYDREEWKAARREKGYIQLAPIAEGTGTKVVPMNRQYADDNATMRAETGAIGRALGLAGMLIIPGSGVASAEDIQEMNSRPERAPADPAAATLPDPGAPPPEQTDEQLRARVKAIAEELESTEKGAAALKRFQEWYAQQQEQRSDMGSLDEIGGAILKGILRRMETTLQQVQAAAEAAAEPVAAE